MALAQGEAGNVRYYDSTWSFDDVDVGKLTGRLARIGLELPVTLRGNVTVRFTVGIPWNSLAAARAWRFHGVLTSGSLAVSALQFHDIRLELRYRDGVLQLEQLAVGVPTTRAGASPGSIEGTARLELVPRGDFSAQLSLAELPLAALSPAIEAFRGIEGRVSGDVSASVAADRMGDVAAWSIEGPVRLEEFVYRHLQPSAASVVASVADGVLTARDFRFRLGSTQLTSGAAINLMGSQAWRVNAKLAAKDLRELLRQLGRALDQPAIIRAADFVERGALRGAATLTGALDRPAEIQASGTAEATSLLVSLPEALRERIGLRPLAAERLAFSYRLSNEAIELSQLDGDLAGGTIAGGVIVPRDEAPIAVNLEWNGLQPALLFEGPFAGSGFAGTLSAAIPLDAAGDLARWDVRMNASLADFAYEQWRLTEARTGEVTLRAGRLVVPNLAAQLQSEPVALSLDMQLAAPYAIESRFNLPRVQLAWLRNIPQTVAWAGQFDGSIAIEGRIAGQLQPLELDGQARVAGENLRMGGRVVDSLRFDLALDGRKATLTNLAAQLYGGQASGNAALTLGEPMGATADLAWTAVDVGAALAGVDLSPVQIAGASGGNVRLTIPPGSFGDRTAWTASGRMQLDAVDVYAWQFRGFAPFDVRLADGILTIPTLRGLVDDSPLEATVSLGIVGPWSLDVRGAAQQARIERLAAIPALSELAARFGGRLDFTTHVSGTLGPVRLAAAGRATAAPLIFDGVPLDEVAFAYDYQPERLQVMELVARLFGGNLTGDVDVALGSPRPDGDELRANLQWRELSVEPLSDALDLSRFVLRGTTSGSVALVVPAGTSDDVAAWEIDAHAIVPELRSNRTEIASLELDVEQRNRALAYTADGRLLGGVLRLNGSRDADAPALGLAVLGTTTLSLHSASLASTAAALASPQRDAPQIAGAVSVTARSSAADGRWSWNGDVRLQDVQANGVALVPGATLRMAGSEDSFRLTGIDGRVAGGTLTGASEGRISGRENASFRIALRGANLEQIIETATGAESDARGDVDVSLRVSPGSLWRINGAVTSGRSQAGGHAIRNVRLPLDAAWHPSSGRMELRAGGVQLSVGGGRVTGRLVARRARDWSIDGNFRFFRVAFSSLAGADYGRGRLSGTLELGGRNVRTANDLTATLQADLEDTQAAKLPLLSQLRNYVPGMSSSATQFGEGRVEAILNRGVIRVQELSLASSQLQIYIEGRATLAGRLDLDGVVSTGGQFNPFEAQSLLTRFALNSVAPVALLAAANDFLANRVVHIAIGGTFQRPVIRLLPFESLREEVVRYFLRQAAATAVPISGAAATGAATAR